MMQNNGHMPPPFAFLLFADVVQMKSQTMTHDLCMTFDLKNIEVTCAMLPKDHCICHHIN